MGSSVALAGELGAHGGAVGTSVLDYWSCGEDVTPAMSSYPPVLEWGAGAPVQNRRAQVAPSSLLSPPSASLVVSGVHGSCVPCQSPTHLPRLQPIFMQSPGGSVQPSLGHGSIPCFPNGWPLSPYRLLYFKNVFAVA